MAKQKTASRGRQRPKRKTIVKDERLLAPTLVDYSTLVTGTNVIIHSMFQTEIPVEDISESTQPDAVLVGRFVYPADYFRALTVMFARQYVVFENGHGKGQEAFDWLQQELTKQAATLGILAPQQPQ